MTFPTASLESLVTKLLINAYEGRRVATYNTPGAFLQVTLSHNKSNERVLLKLTGDFVDIMCEVNPEHKKNIIYEKGKKVLYMEILMTIYGCIESALSWYELYSQTLEKQGFKINPYDKCVTNKIINSKKYTIIWYIDNNNTFHMEKGVVMEVIKIMKGHFGEGTTTEGNKHSFLGMNITITQYKCIQIEIKDQL